MKTVYRRLNDSLTKIHMLRHWCVRQALKGRGIHPKHMPVLDYIKCHSGCTQVEISADMGLTPAAITLATQKLQKDGMVRKKTNPNNLRCNLLELTPVGEEMWNETHGEFYKLDQKEFAGFSEDELNDLREYCDRIMFNLAGKNPDEMSFSELSKLRYKIFDDERMND